MADPIATLDQGEVRGLAVGGVEVFYGVPYAAPPVGALRFAPPAPPPSWRGPRDGTRPGPTAPQPLRAFPNLDVSPLIGAGWRPGPDYLSVNVWRPAGMGPGAAAPVMAFIHGGAWIVGSNASAVQDGAAFARSGVVLVSINYRLGVEGFLPIPGAPTNLGLRDQIAALRWVRDNISAFGGDPDRLTVFGESAGALSLCDLIASPAARGLFRRAIVQSGHAAMTRPIEIGRRLARHVARRLKVPCTVEGFASRTEAEVVAALQAVSLPTARVDLRDDEGFDPAFGLTRFLPVHGDDVLFEPPMDALARGVGGEVEVLIGSNREEMNFYLVPSGAKATIQPEEAVRRLGRAMRRARRVLDAYGLGASGASAGEALCEAMSDLAFRWPARRFAEVRGGRTHLYEFAWRSPAFDGALGACHGLEMPFVFDTLGSYAGPHGMFCGAPAPQALADRIHGLWVAFAKGEPLPWVPYDPATRQVYQLAEGEARREPVPPAAAFLS